jgi:hypothetical protein
VDRVLVTEPCSVREQTVCFQISSYSTIDLLTLPIIHYGNLDGHVAIS